MIIFDDTLNYLIKHFKERKDADTFWPEFIKNLKENPEQIEASIWFHRVEFSMLLSLADPNFPVIINERQQAKGIVDALRKRLLET